MKRRVVVRPRASDDLGEAFRWYEAQRPGLGEALLDEIDAIVAQAAGHPEAFALVSGPCRRALAERFPYAVDYRETIAWVQVLAVFHVRRDPRSLARRLPAP